MVNDSSIKIASKEQIDASPAVLGLYYVFQHLDPIPEKHSTTTLTTKKLEISDDIKKILRDIENENKSTRIVEETTKVADEVESRFGTIIPCVRITLGKKISEEEDYIGEMFSKKIEEARKELDSHLNKYM